MNLITFADTKLAALHREVANEIQRRAQVAANGHDPTAVVFGNELAKRALVVAAAGDHSILFVGPTNCGKTMLRAVALELDLAQTFEAWLCPCGHRTSPNVACRCTVRQVERHLRKVPVAEITVEMQCPVQREMRTPGTTLLEMRQQIASKGNHGSLDLGEVTTNLMRSAVRELNLDHDARRRVLVVARTIANLDDSNTIEPSHLCEAINYRMLGR